MRALIAFSLCVSLLLPVVAEGESLYLPWLPDGGGRASILRLEARGDADAEARIVIWGEDGVSLAETVVSVKATERLLVPVFELAPADQSADRSATIDVLAGELSVDALLFDGEMWAESAPIVVTSPEASCDPASLPRKHSIRRPVGACTPPTLAITSSKPSACPGQSITINWQASDPTARVCIGGVGDDLPSSGFRSVVVTGATVFSGRARSCTVGPASSVSIAAGQTVTASLSAEPSTIKPTGAAELTITVGNATSWRISSSLFAVMLPDEGTGSGTFTASYNPNETIGSDTLRLIATGPCGTAEATTKIEICLAPAVIVAFNATGKSIEVGDNVRFDFTLAGSQRWTLTSANGNLFNVPAGVGSGTFSSLLFGDKVGNDIVRLETIGECGSTVREHPVNICATAPSITLAANPVRVKLGQRTTITLACTSCSAWAADSGGAGLLDQRSGQGSGTFTLSLIANEGLGTFSISAQGVNACGSASGSTTVIVE